MYNTRSDYMHVHGSTQLHVYNYTQYMRERVRGHFLVVLCFSFTTKGLAFRVGGVILVTIAIETVGWEGCGAVPFPVASLRSVGISGGVLLVELVPVGMGRGGSAGGGCDG